MSRLSEKPADEEDEVGPARPCLVARIIVSLSAWYRVGDMTMNTVENQDNDGWTACYIFRDLFVLVTHSVYMDETTSFADQDTICIQKDLADKNPWEDYVFRDPFERKEGTMNAEVSVVQFSLSKEKLHS